LPAKIATIGVLCGGFDFTDIFDEMFGEFIVGGIRTDAYVHAVRADPVRLEQVIGNHSPLQSPLMDAIRDWIGEQEPDSGFFKLGETVSVETFAVGQLVDVSGTTKGRGFSGAIRRHHRRLYGQPNPGGGRGAADGGGHGGKHSGGRS